MEIYRSLPIFFRRWGKQSASDGPNISRKFRRTSPIYAWIGLLDKAGGIVAATDPDTIGRDAGSMAQARQLDGKPAIMVYEIQHDDLLKGQQTVVFSIPVAIPPSSGGSVSFYGYMMTRIKLLELEAIVTRTLQEITTKTDVHERLEYQVLNRHGQVIVESLHQQGGSLDLVALGVQSARLVTAGQTGFVLENHARRSVQVLTGYAPMPARKELQELGWGVLVRADSKAILAPIHSTVRTVTMWGMGIFLPLWLFLLWTMGRLRAEWHRTEVATHAAEEAPHLLQSILDNDLDAHILMDHEGLVGWNLKAEAIFRVAVRGVGKPLEERSFLLNTARLSDEIS